MSTPPLALSLDIGTSSARAILWDETGREVDGARAQIAYQMRTTPDGGVEMDAPEFLTHIENCLDMLFQQCKQPPGQIVCAGVSTFWHSFLALNTHHAPLTPIYNWADTRPSKAAEELRTELDETEIHNSTGCMLHPSYYPARLRWIQKTNPQIFSSAAYWTSPAEYLFSKWFGKNNLCISVSMAAGTGLYQHSTGTWHAEMLHHLNITQDRLPVIADLQNTRSGLLPEYASRWPLLAKIPFCLALGDGACSNAGSGCTDSHRMAINLGTSGAVRVLSEKENTPSYPSPGLWRYCIDSRRPLTGAAFSDGGNLFQWITKNLQIPSLPILEHALQNIEPGSHGLLCLPFFAGERSMGWNPRAHAVLSGMNLGTDAISLAHAMLESVALRFALAADALRKQFPQANEIIASGAALSHSSAWAQMFADAIGSPITLTLEPEASSRGAALLALQVIGCLSDQLPAPAYGKQFIPVPAKKELYAQLLQKQKELYDTLFPG